MVFGAWVDCDVGVFDNGVFDKSVFNAIDTAEDVMVKVSFIGAGNVGAAIAADVVQRNIADEVVLVDIFAELAEGQALDVQHAVSVSGRTKVRAGAFSDIAHSDVVVITAGKARTPDMKDRLQLAQGNVKILLSVLDQIKRYAPDVVLITLTNPMDVMNRLIFMHGFPREKVIGSGGELDSGRLRVVLGHPSARVEAYVMGEHGEDQMPVFSRIIVDGEKKEYTPQEKEDVTQRLRDAALSVIQKKSATVFAPAAYTAAMVQAVVRDEQRMMLCSVNLCGEYGLHDVSLGVPVVLGKRGIEKVVEWDLSLAEMDVLQRTAGKLREFYEKIVL